MSRYLLVIPCPACGNMEVQQRFHECGGKRYIDEDLYLHCDKCNDKTFFMDSRFRCGNHEDYREVNLKNLMLAFASFSASSHIPTYIIEKMVKRALEYHDY